MNKNTILIAITMFSLGFALNNSAIGHLAGAKIAVVDVGVVVKNSAQVKALHKDREKKLQEIEKWVKIAKADVEKQKTDAGKEKLAKKYQADFDKKKADMAKDYEKKLADIEKTISKTIADEAKANEYDVVLTKGAVLYGGVDITNAITKAVK